MEIIGHRGAMGHEPENTLASVQKALELGVDMIEFDVYCLKSGEVVVIHDDRVDRTTNEEGYVWDFSFEELRTLDAGNGQQIPTLQEILDVIDARVSVNIELKGADTAQPVAEVIEEYLKRGWQREQFVVSSFNHHELREFKQISPETRIGALILAIPLDYAQFAETLGAYAVNPGAEFITREFVADAHERDLKVYSWTVNHAEEVRRLQDLGVDGIFTNYPDVARQAMR